MSSLALSPLLVAVIACALTLALTPALRAVARRFGLLDRPNPRSSHVTAVPRGGGVGIALAALGALGFAGSGLGGRATPVLVGAVALAVVGLCDDRFSLPAGVRVAAQLVVALAVVLSLGGLERVPLPPPLDWPLGALGTPLAALWVVAVVNFFNFLDGIDGLATLQAVVTGLGDRDRRLGPVAGARGGSAGRRRSRVPAVQLGSRQRLPGGRRQLLPGLHARGAAARSGPGVALERRALRGAQPLAVPRRRHLDPHPPRPARRPRPRSPPRALVPAAGATLRARQGHAVDRHRIGHAHRLRAAGAHDWKHGAGPGPRSASRWHSSPPRRPPLPRRGPRDGRLALASARLVRRSPPADPDPGPRRASDHGLDLRRLPAAVRGRHLARVSADLLALPAAVPADPALAAPRLRASPLVVPPLGAARGAARRERDPRRHGRVRDGLLLPADARPPALGAGDGVLPDGEPGGCLSLLAALRPDLAARAVALALGLAQAHADRRRRFRRRPAAARPAALRGARLRRRGLRGRRPPQVGPVDRRPPGARADLQAAGDRTQPRGRAAVVRDPAHARRAPARDPGRLRRAQAELQDPAGLVRVPERPRGPEGALRPGARPPAATPRGAVRRRRSSTASCAAGASW